MGAATCKQPEPRASGSAARAPGDDGSLLLLRADRREQIERRKNKNAHSPGKSGRCILRHGGRAGALPTGHFDHVAVRQPLERGVAHLGTVALGEERDHLEDSTSRVELGPLCGTNREWA